MVGCVNESRNEYWRSPLTLTSYRQSREVDPVAQAFEVRKRKMIATGRASPLESVAAFLISISNENWREGRNPRLITEPVHRAAAALPVNFDENALECNLARLEGLGLIARVSNATINLQSLSGLELVADGILVDPLSALPDF